MSSEGMIENGGGVSLYGLDYRSLIYTFDKEGNLSTSRIPFPGGAIPYLPMDVSFQEKSCLLRCFRQEKGSKFYLWDGKDSCKLVDSAVVTGEFKEIQTALGTWLLWNSSSKHETICFIDSSGDVPVLTSLGRYPPISETSDVYFASEAGAQHALFSVKDSLYLVQRKSGNVVAENGIDVTPSIINFR